MATGTYRLNEKKCATCAFWTGSRQIEFNANKPKYIKAEAGSAQCLAQSGKTATPASTCLKYQLWVRLS